MLKTFRLFLTWMHKIYRIEEEEFILCILYIHVKDLPALFDMDARDVQDEGGRAYPVL
jgi:hypothetical protein